MSLITPEVVWAQRSSDSDAQRNHIYLTISVPDVSAKTMKLDIQPTKLTFTGHSDSKKADYHVELEFYAEIDPSESKVHHSARDLEMVLRKKELKAEYWPRLTKAATKLHFLRTDFDKVSSSQSKSFMQDSKPNKSQWVDEDEQDAAPDDDDYMSKMGGGMGGDGGFGGIDFSKLGAGGGGMGGMPDLGDMGAGGDDEDEDDDEDMPELEDENNSVPKVETGGDVEKTEGSEGATGASATKTSKIQEVE
ncbi:MAG: hypothetical protein M1820_001074 [Bogoriella megaspora]|nr:MAG: hypothetical protein M1820_001074 [Bogoriella megaspora]